MYAYDFEVFKHDWLVVFKNEKDTVVVHNDIEKLKNTILGMEIPILVGFNNFKYDDVILYHLLTNSSPNPYELSKRIIEKKERLYPKFKNVLTLDTKQELLPLDLSLKAFEGNIGWNIVESSVPFDIDRKLTEDEVTDVIKYCIHDVRATLRLWSLRQDYFSAKVNMIQEFNLSYQCLKDTKAQIAEVILDATDWTPPKDRLCISYDHNLNWKLIPETVRWFFQKLTKEYLKTFNYKKIEEYWILAHIGGIPHTIGVGGIHGAIEDYVGEGEYYLIDVSSYYPTLMVNNKWYPRSSLSPEKFKLVLNKRFELKKLGDPREEVYKVLLNSIYGVTKSKFSKLFDPVMGNNICINGQLILIQLINELSDCAKLIQSNTDGIIVKINNRLRLENKIKDFGERFNLRFTTKSIKKVVQRDVNNYAVQYNDGDIKSKGVFAEKTWRNNTLNIIPKALNNYYFKNIPIRQTINKAGFIDFQLIAKAGSKYDGICLGDVACQNCNRVFAVPNGEKVTKIKDGTKHKIPLTSDNSQIINHINFTNLDLDKPYYQKLIESELIKEKHIINHGGK